MRVFIRKGTISLLDLITFALIGVTWELVSLVGGNYVIAFITRIARLVAR